MAYYSIFPEKDTTLYSHPDRIHMNTGKDEALELVEEKSTLGNIYYTSRILIKFKNEEIKDVITTKIFKEINTSNCEVNLELFTSENKNLNKDQIIEAFPLSESMSWEEGAQRYDGNPPSTTTGSFQAANGATWVYRTENTSSAWPTGSFATGVTGSYTKQKGGGAWYIGTNFRAEDSFFSAADDLDLNLDVTTIIQKFSASYYQDATYPTGIPNNGFIIKKPSNEEEDNFGYGALQYFSADTHTIYSPKLTFKWDDSSYFHNGIILTSGDIFLSLYNSKQEYQRKSKQRFRLTTRKRYPDRKFTTESNFLNTHYLPAASYYSVRDAETNEVLIPFDTNYTKLSADSEGMYFDLHMEGFQPERYYKLMFRVDNSDGIYIHDEDYSFKIVR